MTRNRSRNRKRSGRSKGGESYLIKALAISTITAVVAVIIGMMYLNFTTNKPEIDPETLCDTRADVEDVVAILIDATEGLPTRSAKNATIYLNNIIQNLPPNSLINLYAIKSGNEDHITPVASMCKPRRGVEINALTGNQRFADKLFIEGFQVPVTNLINDLINEGPSTTSPLIESIQSAVLESFLSYPNAGMDKIIVISDMIQNTGLYSFYSNHPSYPNYKEKNIKNGRGILNLNGIEVNLLIVPRNYPTGSRQDLVKFWSELLKDSGAKNGSTMEPLS